MSTQRLGKGLRALIPETEEQNENLNIQEVALDLIEPNPFQPRQNFDLEKLEELAQSIAEFGLLEPVILRKNGQSYQLVAGERRVRGAKLAGLAVVPALIRDYTDLEMMQVALIENLQRENLNPIEEAKGYQRLIAEFDFTQNQVAEAVGKKRPSVANTLRLLNLGKVEQELLETGAISMGHAKVLLGVKGTQKREKLAKEVAKLDLSVRQLEDRVKPKSNVPRGTLKVKSPELLALEDELQRKFSTKVQVSYKQGVGKISIEYYSDEELERLLEIMNQL